MSPDNRSMKSNDHPRFRFVADRCLVVPDVHQDLAWLKRILAAEESNCDLIVFLGDYFDSVKRPDEVAPVAEVARWMRAYKEANPDRVVLLLGNHDLHYWEAAHACWRQRSPKDMRYATNAFSKSHARKIAKEWDASFWAKLRLFVEVNGWLLSHAGLAAEFGYPHLETDAALSELDAHCELVLRDFMKAEFPILHAGRVRGGYQPVGGILWQDWFEEFEDSHPLPQIVGHSKPRGGSAPARQKGRSWCLDGAQTTYGILTSEGLGVKTA